VENEKEEVSNSRQVARETFDIEGIGEFRAKPGTALAEIAGAASFWEKTAKRYEAAILSDKKENWRNGFTAGLAAALAIGTIAFGLYRLLA
jgi:hypothetical protein